jgi:hypothetical protein
MGDLPRGSGPICTSDSPNCRCFGLVAVCQQHYLLDACAVR